MILLNEEGSLKRYNKIQQFLTKKFKIDIYLSVDRESVNF